MPPFSLPALVPEIVTAAQQAHAIAHHYTSNGLYSYLQQVTSIPIGESFFAEPQTGWGNVAHRQRQWGLERMRKILLGTTALVAAGLLGTGEAAAKFDVTVRGNYTAGYGFVNEDDDEGESGHTRQNQALNQDAEVHFRFEQTLDNGIIVGGRVELEGATHNEREGGSTGSRFSRSAGTDQIDEKWGYVRGGFGELRFGDEDDARKQKSYGAPEASGIFGVNSPYFTYNNTATGQVASTNSTFPNLENDSAKVIYFTPSFGGFQLAVSYAPDGTQDRAQGGTGGTDESQLSNATSIGADYSGEFGGVTVGVGGGYSFANVENNDEDPSIWAVGVNVGFGGFTVGGSVVFGDELDGGNSAAFNGLTVDEATVFDVGATYTIDAVTVGVGFSRGEYEDANDGEDDQLDHIQLGVGYALGEGVNLGAMVGWFDYEDEGPDDVDNTGWQTGVGINMGF
jgi:outer membrane protein OmpU